MNPTLMKRLRRERLVKFCAFLAVLLTAMIIVLAVDNLLASFVLAFVTNYLLAPVVDFFERRGVPRQTAILIPFLAAGCLIVFGVYQILPLITQQITLFESQLPKYQVDLMNLVGMTENRFKGFFKIYNINFADTINHWIIRKTTELSSDLPSAVSGSLTVFLLAPIFAFFMLHDGRNASRSMLAMVPNNLFETALNLQHRLNEQMGGFIRARFLEAAIVGIVVWIGLQAAGFPYAPLLALFAALTNLIPYIGPIIGAIPAVLIALISRDAMITDSMSWNLIIVTSIFFLAQLIDIIFVIPLVVAKIVNLHPVTVIIVIIVGSQVMGILGMIIAIPVTSAIKLIFHAFYEHLVDFRS
jgi:putative permease